MVRALESGVLRPDRGCPRLQLPHLQEREVVENADVRGLHLVAQRLGLGLAAEDAPGLSPAAIGMVAPAGTARVAKRQERITFATSTRWRFHQREKAEMARMLLSVVAGVVLLAPVTQASAQAGAKRPVAVTPGEVRWFTPPYYTDGRQRASLFGDSRQDGVWVDRARIPGNLRVLAHTHPHDELATVISGTWYVGIGPRFDRAKLKAYPAGSFVMIPAGTPHFAATKDGPVIVQLNGVGKWGTDYVEK